MKTIGLIGGMSWESTRIYYELLNRDVQQRLGGLHSARVIISSLDMAVIAGMQSNAQWHEAGELLANEAIYLEHAGADAIALATNTMHKCAPQIIAAIHVPFLHIVDALVVSLKHCKRERSLLLATRFTMEDGFYRDHLTAQGIDTVLPTAENRVLLHDIIFQELCKGVVNDASRKIVKNVIDAAQRQGADSVILGCTEICMLVDEANTSLPVFDTARIHAKALVDFSVAKT